jgi:hypothetical protein
MANPNIGHILCPISGKHAVLRAQCNGKVYWFSDAGKITPALAVGQEYIEKHGVMWDAPNSPPENVQVKPNYRGAPPIVTVESKALTGEGAERREEKPAPKKKQSGIFDFLGGNE